MARRLIVKPAINFLSIESDVDLDGTVAGILYALKDNPNYPDPTPSLAVVDGARTAFSLAITAASNGGKLLTLAKNTKRAELVSLVRQLAAYITLACNGDLIVLMGSGFPIHKPSRHTIGHLSAPQQPNLRRGPQSGDLTATVKPIYGAKIYNWVIALTSSPDLVIQTVQSTGSRAILRGLIPGEKYCVKANAVGAAGPSDWSGLGFLIVV